jgi:cytochrome P450 monooxygenase
MKMPHVVQLLTALSCGIVTWYFYRYLRRYQALQALAKQHGCKEVPRYPHQSWFGGLDLIRLRQEAVEQGRFLPLFEEHFALYGKTFEENFVGSRRINTIHSKNIQQILTTSINNFRKNPPGRHFASPFFGESLTTTDGNLWRYSRNLVKPTFARAELSDIDGLGKFVDRMMKYIPTDGTTFDIQPLLHKMVCKKP